MSETTEATRPADPRIPLGHRDSNYSEIAGGAQRVLDNWWDGMLAITQETTRFVQLRFSEDLAAWSELAACRTPEQFRDCQQRFATKATEEYASEFGKLSQMMLSLTVRQPDRAGAQAKV